jgi:Fe-S cluster assembly scaffold IscU
VRSLGRGIITNTLCLFLRTQVIDHYEHPRNVGSLNKADPFVGTGLVGAPACGDVMKLQIKVDEETGKIVDVKFKTFGCGSAIASSSYMTERVRGMTLEDAGAIKNTEVAKELCLPPVKLHCSSKYFIFFLNMILRTFVRLVCFK